jgi:hypothetical protein
MVDCNDEVQVIKAFGVARIAWMDRGTLPPDMNGRFPQLKGEVINLQQDVQLRRALHPHGKPW